MPVNLSATKGISVGIRIFKDFWSCHNALFTSYPAGGTICRDAVLPFMTQYTIGCPSEKEKGSRGDVEVEFLRTHTHRNWYLVDWKIFLSPILSCCERKHSREKEKQCKGIHESCATGVFAFCFKLGWGCGMLWLLSKHFRDWFLTSLSNTLGFKGESKITPANLLPLTYTLSAWLLGVCRGLGSVKDAAVDWNVNIDFKIL